MFVCLDVYVPVNELSVMLELFPVFLKFHSLSFPCLPKIPFINKGMESIDLHNTFKDNLVISSISNYFNNSETSIICYKYNKPIRSTIFNFNKIVTDINIDSNNPDS